MTDTIDVWRIRPLRRAGDVASLRAILPADELARAERQRDDLKLRAWITSRAAMRLLLSNYTRIPATDLRFAAGQNGKPFLQASQNEQGITFNFSDSGDMALLAVGRSREVGVDVEKVREVERAREIAVRRLSSAAAAQLEQVSGEERSRVFLQTWARHEALIKAQAGTIWNPQGEKLNLTLSGAHSYVQSGLSFTVRDLDAGQDYVGALAAQGEGWSIDVKDYSD